MEDRLADISKKVIHFRDERDWKQFHDPKNLAEAISIESAELLENFLWVATDNSRDLDSIKLARIKEEVADVAIFLIYLCNSLGIDLLKEVETKIETNRKKYPLGKSKGSSRKYTDF